MPYREGAPIDGSTAPDRRRRIILTQIAIGLVAGALLIATAQELVTCVRLRSARATEVEKNLAGSEWAGNSGGYPFRMFIDSVHDGKVEGRMEWPRWGTTRVNGTIKGDELDLVDTKVLSGYVPIGDRKHIRVSGDTMSGTDKDGATSMTATRVR
jgi:hypothetical protein